MRIRNSDEYKEMDATKAVDIIEGELSSTTVYDELVAWQFLVDNDLCDSLQGFYSRTAQYLIDNDFIEAKGA